MVASLSRVSNNRVAKPCISGSKVTELRFSPSRVCSAARPVSILLVSPQSLLSRDLRQRLQFHSPSSACPYSVVGEAATREQAVSLTRQHQPTLLLLDMEFGQQRESGVYLLRSLREFYSGKILVVSGEQEDDLVFQVMKAGASGYLLKDRLPTHLHQAIAALLSDQVYLDPEVATQFFRCFQLNTGTLPARPDQVHLSERELEVLQRLVQGDPNADIARSLYITVATVKAHLTSIFEKLGVKSRSQAIVTALRLGLV